MLVRDGMSTHVITIGPRHTLREAARTMSQRRVGAAVVGDPDMNGPGILTERDIMDSIGRGEDPDVELAGEHLTADLVYAAPDWDLHRAARAMVRGGFRHLIVLDGDEIAGMLAMRDIVRMWAPEHAPA
ncbi:MAG: CBS domain-containing protein [Actinomycetota bacterium]|nr:CBS domain-containing protein [Actinomycetota bacterium]